MSGVASEIRTTFRRPCLLRMVSESDVDSPKRGRAPPSSREGFPFSLNSGGSNGIDDRVLTLDHEARTFPRCSGLRKGRVNAPLDHDKPTKSDSIRTLQAFGIPNNSDIDLIAKRSRSGSQDPPERLKVEALQGMPLSGRGADIALMGGRRNSYSKASDRACSPREAKQELHGIDIDQQLRRRHASAPPSSSECRRRDDFEHRLSAEGYSYLLGRPEGPMRNGSLRYKERAFTVRPRRHNQSNDNGGKDSPASSGFREVHYNSTAEAGNDEGASAPAQSAQLIAALRDATRNTPAEAVWDAMLNTIAESPELFHPKTAGAQGLTNCDLSQLNLPAKVAAAVAAAAAGSGLPSPTRTPRVGSPTKKHRSRTDESPQRSPGHRNRMSRNASDASVMSAFTADASTADTGNAYESAGSHTPSGGSVSSSTRRTVPGSRRVACSASDWLRGVQSYQREEEWKRRRRAQWVA